MTPTRELIEELLTVEAKLTALGQHGAHLRSQLQERAEKEYRDNGTAPTWRAKGLGTVTLPVRAPRTRVRDMGAFASYAAQRHTDHVEAAVVLTGSPSRMAELVDAIRVFSEDGSWPEPSMSLVVDPAWLTGFLEDVVVSVIGDEVTLFDPVTAEPVEGLAWSEGGPGSVAVRLDPEAKRRAAATANASGAELLAPLPEGVSA